ncbi:MAG TPA: L,D-transpeptidase [Solirubrobacterales bacterium]|nr:L,D-transpeptidase [Solirubrobacterales bacterium]
MKRLSSLFVAVAVMAMPAAVAAAPKQPSKPAPVPDATVKIEVGGLHGGRAQIYDTVPVRGTLSPYVPGQKVEVTFYLDGRRLVRHRVAVARGAGATGTFESSVVVKEDGRYAVAARHVADAKLGGDSTVRKRWKVSFPSLHPGECSEVVKGFKKAMAEMGYVAGGGKCFNGRLGREVLAYRKVNGMNRSQKAGAGLVKRVFGGKGAYRPRYPNAGEHAEVPLSKQVLVLIKKGKPFAVYPVSTGKPSTPTITGHYHFYRQEPGYNAEGMYYSFYWHGGYAVHGYAEVPDYAASHGCIRTFIADQPRIYEQLHFGESIFVF